MGLEPTTTNLEGWHSTIELHPRKETIIWSPLSDSNRYIQLTRLVSQPLNEAGNKTTYQFFKDATPSKLYSSLFLFLFRGVRLDFYGLVSLFFHKQSIKIGRGRYTQHRVNYIELLFRRTRLSAVLMDLLRLFSEIVLHSVRRGRLQLTSVYETNRLLIRFAECFIGTSEKPSCFAFPS